MQRPALGQADRGLATGIIAFVAVLVVVALMYTLLDPALVGVTDSALGSTSNAQAESEINEAATIWGYMPLFGLFLAAMLLISRSVFESRGPG